MDAVTEAEQVISAARSLFNRGLTHGSTGNVSLRTAAGILVTPTGSSLGVVTAEELSLIDSTGAHLSGPRPSKEAFLHAAILRARPDANAVVHTHSTYSAAVSCLADVDDANALPPLTAYYAMRVGTLPLLPYHAPGDMSLEELAEQEATRHHALLLSNHGPVVAGMTLSAAMDALEEIEETAKLFLLLRTVPTRPLTETEVAALRPPR
ncbi:3-oxo-tetronate 4-phosphate decarboxylase [Arthrobacter ruber]|uniref:3-oxo-tetronate 4-phosphate decarboxylase n=1 Tax=Arthrobacter ruber TaxID=1258893 RepID=UPI000CF3B42D|nr:3-oxo-tetronate 4-phosphate decarboxylase [Arthrobacter ruber]